MTAESMAEFRCWTSEEVASTVYSDIGALPPEMDGLFLAAHTPIALEHQKGIESASGTSGEREVLDALTRWIGVRLDENTLVAVTGSSGSGKSHVVRWVHANLPNDESKFHVLYVPRAVQTLRELLRRIIEGLPGVEGKDLMDRVDAAISNVKPGELQARLANEMKIALDWTLEERGAHDGESEAEAAARRDRNDMLGYTVPETGGRRDGLAELLEIPKVKETLLRSGGRVAKLVDSYFDESSRRDGGDETFTDDDLPLHDRGVLTAMANRPEMRELWNLIRSQPTDALELLEEALRVALPQVTGLRSSSGDTLDSLFISSRRALKSEGKELVLLFEDLSQFGLVDADLYNQFATQPNAELAPLRVVFAITDGAYGRMERTVLTRVKERFHVGGAALADPNTFVARYLNLVRVGRAETLARWQGSSGSANETDWMANACDTRDEGRPCRFRDKCHSDFEKVNVPGLGDVGLYPYNIEALRRALNEVADFTPRGVMDQCVTINLMEADRHIEEGDYPHARTEKLFDFRPRKMKQVLLESNPSSDPDRNYRALVIWGNESALRSGVLEAFSLDGTAAVVAPPEPLPSGPTPPQTLQLENPLLPLFEWQNGMALSDDETNYYRDTLRRFTFDRLQLDEYLTHIFSGRGKEMLDRLFNRTSFVLEGARGAAAGENSVRFPLTRSDEDVLIMAAARWFRDHGHFDPARALWQWPGGSDPVPLLIAFEARLDGWAAEVRSRFLELSGGTRLAQNAVGIRAVALCASGRNFRDLQSTSAVLNPPSFNGLSPDVAWAPVHEVATSIVSSLAVADYVGEFASVRQGERGDPQLVDTLDVDATLLAFLEHPLESLGAVVEDGADPILAQSAKRLFDAIALVARDEYASAVNSSANVAVLLEGNLPSSVGPAVNEVGHLARENGLFRPSDMWLEFQKAVETISAGEVLEFKVLGDDVGGLLRSQGGVRRTHQLEVALNVVMRVMVETKKECERGGLYASDIPKQRAKVKKQIAQLTNLVGEIGPEPGDGRK